MSRALSAFLEKEIQDAKDQGILFSLHLKATMMKVSDPIIFGHCVKAFLKDLFAKHAATFDELGVNPDLGLGDLEAKIATLPAGKKEEVTADLKAALENGPALYMVNSDKGLTNLHVSSDVIIDASMPALNPRRAAKVGARTVRKPTRNASFPTAPMPVFIPRSSISAKKTARSTRPRWAPCRMSA